MHSVYFIFDEPGNLLYIGCAKDLDRRLAEHFGRPWFKISHTVKHKAFEDREFAERLEARAIRLYNPLHNIKGSRVNKPDYSERTKAGIAAAKAAGKTFGRKYLIKDDEVRLKYMRKLHKAGKIVNEKGEPALLDVDLLAELNKGNPDSKINSLETVRRWRREGYPGLEEQS